MPSSSNFLLKKVTSINLLEILSYLDWKFFSIFKVLKIFFSHFFIKIFSVEFDFFFKDKLFKGNKILLDFDNLLVLIILLLNILCLKSNLLKILLAEIAGKN